MEDFYRICVAVPLTVAAIPCDLYLCRKPDGVLELVCSCDCGLLPRPEPAVWPVYLSEISYIDGGHFVAPINNFAWRLKRLKKIYGNIILNKNR